MNPTDAKNLLTRRQTLAVAGLAGAAYVVGRGPLGIGPSGAATATTSAEAASCVLTPAKTEGPYWVDELLNRSDIRSDSDGSNTRDGVLLTLTITVVREDEDCAPAEGVTVDIWHCDAEGNYSDESASTQDNTLGHDYLRGYQVTDSNGQVKFTTIYPGWYAGRTIHIHFKVRTFESDEATYEFTSQLFFDQTVNDTVQATATYDGTGTTTNSQDTIYGDDTEVLVPLSGSVANDYTGAITLGLTGLPASYDQPAESGDEVDGKLASVSFERGKRGKRVLKLKLAAGEALAADARLLRAGNRVAHREKDVPAGGGRLRLPIDNDLAPGHAKLRLELTDAAGATKTITKNLRIPGRT